MPSTRGRRAGREAPEEQRGGQDEEPLPTANAGGQSWAFCLFHLSPLPYALASPCLSCNGQSVNSPDNRVSQMAARTRNVMR